MLRANQQNNLIIVIVWYESSPTSMINPTLCMLNTENHQTNCGKLNKSQKTNETPKRTCCQQDYNLVHSLSSQALLTLRHVGEYNYRS